MRNKRQYFRLYTHVCRTAVVGLLSSILLYPQYTVPLILESLYGSNSVWKTKATIIIARLKTHLSGKDAKGAREDSLPVFLFVIEIFFLGIFML